MGDNRDGGYQGIFWRWKVQGESKISVLHMLILRCVLSKKEAISLNS